MHWQQPGMEQEVVRLYLSYYPLEIYNNYKIIIALSTYQIKNKTKYPNERYVPHRWTIHKWKTNVL